MWLPQEKTVITKGNGTILNSTSTKELYKRASILGQSHIVLPHATLDLSNGFNGTITAKSLELSTLVWLRWDFLKGFGVKVLFSLPSRIPPPHIWGETPWKRKEHFEFPIWWSCCCCKVAATEYLWYIIDNARCPLTIANVIYSTQRKAAKSLCFSDCWSLLHLHYFPWHPANIPVQKLSSWGHK